MTNPRALSLLLAAMPLLARAAEPPTRPMRDAATHDQLALIHRSAPQIDPMRKLRVATGADPSLVNQPKDLLSESDILCFGGAATLVPKRAILNTPKNLAERLKFQPGSVIQGWAEFYAQNRGWITTVEVSRSQAEGNLPLLEEIAGRVRKSSNLVVATYQNGPISLLPLKEPPAPKGDAKPAATTGEPAGSSGDDAAAPVTTPLDPQQP